MEDNFFQLSVGRTSYLRGVSVVELGVVGAHLDLSEVEVHEIGILYVLCEIYSKIVRDSDLYIYSFRSVRRAMFHNKLQPMCELEISSLSRSSKAFLFISLAAALMCSGTSDLTDSGT